MPDQTSPDKITTEADWWLYVDSTLAQAIKNYEELTTDKCGDEQPIFIDLIIKLIICRAYANNMNQKPLTAYRYLNKASDFIARLREWEEKDLSEDLSQISARSQTNMPTLQKMSNRYKHQKFTSKQKAKTVGEIKNYQAHNQSLYILNENHPQMNMHFREGSYAIPVDILE